MSDMFQLFVEGGSSALSVVSVDGSEAVNKLSRFDVTVKVSGADAESFMMDTTGAVAMLTIGGDSGRRIGGVVSRVEALAREPHSHHHWLRLRLRPALWRLKKRDDSRVFQSLTTAQIVSEVLGQSVRHEWRLQRQYQPRGYCVQYQESDYAFIRRLLSEDGINFWFDDRDRLVFADSAEATQRIAEPATLVVRPDTGALREDALMKLEPAIAVATTSTTTRFYDYERPHVDFVQRAQADESGPESLEVYDL